MTQQYDVAVIGGGIVGLAHAWMASRRGLRVVLLERTAAAEGASVRNFGMIWPIGQPAGERYQIALRSRESWLELDEQGVVNAEQCGSIHLAHRPDELTVLDEFSRRKSHETNMLTREQVVERSPLANPNGLLGGLFSSTELRVDPRVASARIAAWLAEAMGVQCHFRTPIVAIEDHVARAADGRSWRAERIIIASGADLQTLRPEMFAAAGLVLCKLQMLRSVAQPVSGTTAPHLASGLTLRHYTSFRDCAAWPALQARIARELPELDRFGIHVMASQFPTGEVILGDSHEYGELISPFDQTEIDELILRECRKVFQLNDWTISQRWHGIYGKHPTLPVFESRAEDGTHAFVGTGGAGMTMSFGLAERAWQRWLGETP